jgi:hypothetical protein
LLYGVVQHRSELLINGNPKMIAMTQRLAGQRTPDNIMPWEATTEIAGIGYTARSRRGAPFALARVLIAAGIPDQPVIVTTDGVRGTMRYPSLVRMAGLTMIETAKTPLRLAKHSEMPSGLYGKPKNHVTLPAGGVEGGTAPVTPKNAAPVDQPVDPPPRFRRGS